MAAALLLAACTAAQPEPTDPPARTDIERTVPALHAEVDGWEATTVTLTPPDGEVAHVAARVAVTPEQRRRGLMRVPDVPDGAGMLFLFDRDRAGGFWMLDTLVALDIAFIADGGEVAAVLTMQPCVEQPCPVYDPDVVYRAALEVPAGWFAANGVGVGTQVTWTEPAPAPAAAG